VYGVSSSGVQRPGRGVDHPRPPSAEVEKRVELYGTSTPSVGLPSPFYGKFYYYRHHYHCIFVFSSTVRVHWASHRVGWFTGFLPTLCLLHDANPYKVLLLSAADKAARTTQKRGKATADWEIIFSSLPALTAQCLNTIIGDGEKNPLRVRLAASIRVQGDEQTRPAGE
jgi:hypothetical protein